MSLPALGSPRPSCLCLSGRGIHVRCPYIFSHKFDPGVRQNALNTLCLPSLLGWQHDLNASEIQFDLANTEERFLAFNVNK